MRFTERPLLFDCEGERLVGVVAEPESSAGVAVLVIVGGPQYRVGSHRQFVLLARRLAAAGFPVLRFDYRGMGDSTGAARTFEECGADIAAALDAMREIWPEVERVVLWGLCDAASAALDYWNRARDDRVGGLVLLNPWVRSEASLARTHVKHYYAKRLLAKDFWSKLLGGGVRPAATLRELAHSLRLAASGRARDAEGESMSFQDRMAAALRAFEGPVLLILSGDDLTAREFLEYAQSGARWRGVLQSARIERVDIPRADHTFSSKFAADEVEMRTLRWLRASMAVGMR